MLNSKPQKSTTTVCKQILVNVFSLTGRKLSRGISRATDNEGLVWALRNNTEPEPNTINSDHILLLPDISVYPPDFR